MAISYSQWMWGFEVFDSTAGSAQNNLIDVHRAAMVWQASTAYSVGAILDPSGANASSTQLWKCTTAGTSGSSQPAWPASPTPGSTTQADGSAVWTYQNTVDWQASSPNFAVGSFIYPTAPPASSNQLWKCTQKTGNTGASISWPISPTVGQTQSDNNVVWTFQGYVTSQAAVIAGVYTPDELASAVASALQAIDTANSYACSFSYSTLLFASSGLSNFDLKWSSGAGHSKNLSGLLGVNNALDRNAIFSQTSDSAVGGPYSTAKLWAAVDPLVLNSPAIAQPAGAAAQLTARALNTRQHVSDGATVESVYVATLRRIYIAFRALLPSEQTNMEAFLDWAVQGKRLTWQPDTTSANVLKLVLANPGEAGPMFEWLTRQEAGYGTLTFIEQLS